MAGDSEQRLEEQGQPSGGEPFLIGVSGGTASGKVRGERGAGIGCTRRPRAQGGRHRRATCAAAAAAPGHRVGTAGTSERNVGLRAVSRAPPCLSLNAPPKGCPPAGDAVILHALRPDRSAVAPPFPPVRVGKRCVWRGGVPLFLRSFLGYFSFWRGTLGHRVASC